MKKESKVYDDPRISVNPLCEYVDEATASRRNSIIKQCKRPLTFITKWYNHAEELLSLYLSAVRDEPKMLRIELGRLRSRVFTDESEEKYANASADALQSFLISGELSVRKELAPYTLEMAVHDNKHKFIMNGVRVSLRPEIILRDKDGKQQLGFVKFYFSKNDPLKQDKGELMACLVKHYFEQEYGFTFKTNHCIVLDVYNGTMFYAPKAFKRRIADIEAACQEIADRWDRIVVD